MHIFKIACICGDSFCNCYVLTVQWNLT